VGPDYNGCLMLFVYHHWSIRRAEKQSASLARAWRALAKFHPLATP